MWKSSMTANAINAAVLWLNTIGLVAGSIGGIVLALISKSFITIGPDGDECVGPDPDAKPKITQAQWKAHNLRFRKWQKRLTRPAYFAIFLGFLAQLLALWMPSLL